ncbi:carbon-monoxide dehydrogenase small subunit [Rhodoligotrophos appendicifer]|uniref:(2Fe-2S)-binding protein n=1 Tax=Rhodoligotrophos appendicifer TaxID=987056 RepID=UPI0011802602|nr:(2Fe-2S)-binding protein [Rhodoligotrophos appendicifer]
MHHPITLTVNGRAVTAEVEPRVHLADFLRHQLNLTGTHLGCEHGVCGACTILVDGDAVRSCLMLAVQADGADIVTIEGLQESDGTLNALQTAFRKHHALQCGFCTPGFLATLTQILRDRPEIEEDELRGELSGNLCRCTGYSGIVDAALEVARGLRQGGTAP